jgi:hypothetical protein
MPSEAMVFPIGGMWEESAWRISFDEECIGYDGLEPCPHCRSDHIEEDEWICPRVIIMRNEGGYNSTGLCLDCVLDAVKTLEDRAHQT